MNRSRSDCAAARDWSLTWIGERIDPSSFLLNGLTVHSCLNVRVRFGFPQEAHVNFAVALAGYVWNTYVVIADLKLSACGSLQPVKVIFSGLQRVLRGRKLRDEFARSPPPVDDFLLRYLKWGSCWHSIHPRLALHVFLAVDLMYAARTFSSAAELFVGGILAELVRVSSFANIRYESGSRLAVAQ